MRSASMRGVADLVVVRRDLSWDGRAPDACKRCLSAGSIEFGICQVCLHDVRPSVQPRVVHVDAVRVRPRTATGGEGDFGRAKPKSPRWSLRGRQHETMDGRGGPT